MLFKRKSAAPAGPSAERRAVGQAVLTPALAAMASDGVISREELDQLRTVCATSPIFRGPGAADAADAAVAAFDAFKRDGLEGALANAAAVLSPELRETAIAFAMRIAMADGGVDDGEYAMIAGVAERWGVPAEAVARIAEVLIILQRPDAA